MNLHEAVRLERNRRQSILGAVTWEQTDTGILANDEVPGLKQIVSDLVTHFLRDYQKTHAGIRLPPAPKVKLPVF